jgi:hypothetical protein
MNFKKDTSAVRDFSGGAIKETDFYAGTITKAYDRDSLSSDAKAIHLDFVADNGQSAQIDLWHTAASGLQTDKNGKSLPAMRSINDLMVILDIDDLKSKPGMVDIYDYDLREDVKTKKMVYTDLIGRHIGAVFQMVQEGKRSQVNGEWTTSTTEFKNRPEFKMFCTDEGLSAREFLDGSEPVVIQKYLDNLEPIKGDYLPSPIDAHIIKQAYNKPNAPIAPIPYDSFDDDIPFN